MNEPSSSGWSPDSTITCSASASASRACMTASPVPAGGSWIATSTSGGSAPRTWSASSPSTTTIRPAPASRAALHGPQQHRSAAKRMQDLRQPRAHARAPPRGHDQHSRGIHERHHRRGRADDAWAARPPKSRVICRKLQDLAPRRGTWMTGRALIKGLSGTASLVLAAACLLPGTAFGANATVDVGSFRFTPSVVTIDAGRHGHLELGRPGARTTTSTRAYPQRRPIPSRRPCSSRTRTSPTRGRSRRRRPANTYNYTFATAGTYNYWCRRHPRMIASVVVNEAPPAPVTPTAEPVTPAGAAQDRVRQQAQLQDPDPAAEGHRPHRHGQGDGQRQAR